MSGKSANLKVSKVLTYILIFLVIVGVLGFVAYFTNGFTGDFKEFYVNVDGKNVLAEESGVMLSADAPLTANVKYTFGAFSDDISGYHLAVLPATDFDFTVDGEAHKFADEKDLSAGFEITEGEEEFTLTPKGSLADILKAVYPDSEIDFDKRKVPLDTDLFKVVVYSQDKSAHITIGCRLKDPFMEGVILDKEVIVF